MNPPLVKPPATVGSTPVAAQAGNKPVPPIAKIGSIVAIIKRASGADSKPSAAGEHIGHDEYDRRKDRVRKIVGTIMGAGYGAFGGTLLGKEVFDQPAGRSAAIGAGLGALGGFGVGSAIGHVGRYTGEHRPERPINIIIPQNPHMEQRVDSLLTPKSASVRTIVCLVKRASRQDSIHRAKQYLIEKLGLSDRLGSTMAPPIPVSPTPDSGANFKPNAI
jgi:hypothetical protein